MGRIERSNAHLDLTIEVVDPVTTDSLRSTAITDNALNLASFQQEPILRIADMIGLELRDDEVEEISDGGTNIPSSLSSYLRGLGGLRSAGVPEQVDKAIESLNDAVAADPACSAARIALAEAHLRMYQLSRESAQLDLGLEAAALAENRATLRGVALRVTGSIQRAAGRLEEAAAVLEEAIEVAPNDAEARIDLGRTYQAMDRIDDAQQQLHQAIYLRPGYWPTHHWLALVYYRQGNYEAAATEFRHVVESAPESFKGYNNLANVYDKLGRRTESLAALQRSVELEPENNPVAFVNLGKLYFDDARFADAANLFERSLAVRPNSSLTWGNLAYSYASGVDPSKTEDAARKAIELGEKDIAGQPDDAWILSNLAGYHALVGEVEEGVALLDRAVLAGPHDPTVIGNIAGTWEDLGERERALEWVERAFEAGVLPSRFVNRPLLRGLIADERYHALTSARNGR